MKGSEALENIKGIELMHVEHDQDEGIDGEWVYEDTEVYDGTVAENYPDEIEALEKERKALEIIKNKGVLVDMLRKSVDVDDYNIMANYYDINYCKLELLSREEYVLLKEELE